jgi:hypothetical protein
MNRRAIDKPMKTDNATFGHWAMVMPPVRRLANIHRTPRPSIEDSPFVRLASSGVITVTVPTVVTARKVQCHVVRRNRIDNSDVLSESPVVSR